MAGVAGVTVTLLVVVIVPALEEKRGFIRVVKTQLTAELPAAARYLMGRPERPSPY
jgi:hypothetical protein